MSMLPFRRLPAAAAAIALAATLLGGCGGPDAETSFAKAQDFLAKKDMKPALIELKNALQGRPDWPEARLLLGKTLLEVGDPVAAVVELRKARDLKVPDEQVLTPLVVALVRSGDFKRGIELGASAAPTAPQDVADLKTALTVAYARAGQNEAADAALAAALKAQPEHRLALLLQARTLGNRQKYDEALAAIDKLLAAHPKDGEALALKGDLVRVGKRDLDAAAALYRQSLEAEPGNLSALTQLMEIPLSAQQVEPAKVQMDALRKAHPNHPMTAFYDARLAMLQGDYKRAKEDVGRFLKADPENPGFLQLAGVVATANGEFAQAEKHLAMLAQKEPDAPTPKRLLAFALLRSGDPAKALEVLRPLLESASPDAPTLALAGTAYLATGDNRRAQETLARAARLDPTDIRSRTALAVARASTTGDQSGYKELEALAESDKTNTADMALIGAYFERKDLPAALKAIDRLEKKAPTEPTAPVLRARVLAAQGNLAAARAELERALKLSPGNLLVIDGLAGLDVRENKMPQARARFEELVKNEPSNSRALLGLALLDERAGRPKAEVAALLSRAVAAVPTDMALRSRLVRFLLSRDDVPGALKAAQDAASVAPDDPVALQLLGETLVVAGDHNQAISTLGRLVNLRPNSLPALLALIEAQSAAKAYDDAAATARRAMALSPSPPPALQAAVRVEMLRNRPAAARELARAAQAAAPKSPEGWLLEGEIEAAGRNWPAAAAAYRAALQRQDSPIIAQRLHAALVSSGDRGKADAFAAERLARLPKEPMFLVHLSTVDIAERKWPSAIARLQQVVAITPDDPVAWNNLAWAQASNGDPAAVESARKALFQQPNNASLLDTLAFAYGSQKQFDKAIETQKRAIELRPGIPSLKLGLARLYLESGDKQAARAELDALAKLGDRFADQAGVRDLQSRL